MPPKLFALLVAATVLAAGALWWRGGQEPTPTQGLALEDRVFADDDPMTRACELADRVLLRIWRGHHKVHSEDITTVPHFPNYSGSFGVTSHSGPWDYVQTIPLVLYGPGQIAPNGRVDEPANITDVYPTVAALAGVEIPAREGRVLPETLEPIDDVPR